MGQDQSLQPRTPHSRQTLNETTQRRSHRRTLSDQPLTNTDERILTNRFYSTINLQEARDSEYLDHSTPPSEQEDEEVDGMINVVTATIGNQDPILSKLQQLGPVRPLIPNSTRSPFGLESLIDIGSTGMKSLLGKETTGSSSSSIKTNSSVALTRADDPLVDILLSLQAHINTNMSKINLDQRRLLQRIRQVDELSVKTSHAMSMALYQSKGASDRLNEAKHIKVLAKETRHYVTSIFETMHRIQHQLDPEDCIGHPDFEKRWPVLHSLHQRAMIERPPAFLPSSSSSSSTFAKDDRNQHRQKSSTAATTVSLANVASTSETSSLTPSSVSSESASSAPNDQYPSSTMNRLQRLINESTPHSQTQDNVYPETPSVE